MVRPCVNGNGKRAKVYTRRSVDYDHKNKVLNFFAIGKTMKDVKAEFYLALPDKDWPQKRKQIRKWAREQAHTIRAACDAGRGQLRNMRRSGDGKILPTNAEEQIALWINSVRKEGAPVSPMMLQLKVLEVAAETGAPDVFCASNTWVRLFLRRSKMFVQARTRQGQTTPNDAVKAAQAFRALVLQTVVERECVQVYNADQTAALFEYLPKRTVNHKGAKTVWVKCANKDKERATAMLLGDWQGRKYPPFILFKSTQAKSTTTQAENNQKQNGFGVRLWHEIHPLMATPQCQIYSNKAAWWNSTMSMKFLEYHFANREIRSENVLLLWDDFSGHWTQEVVDYTASIKVVLLKVPPRYTYMYQPADLAWVKPFKDRTRAFWVDNLRKQLSVYTLGAEARNHKKKALEDAVAKVRMDHNQEDAAALVNELVAQHREEPFALKAPSRRMIVEWVAASWEGLTKATVTAGFTKTGLTSDSRCTVASNVATEDMASIIDELQQLDLTSDVVDSDEDVGDESESEEELAA